jgi:3',5'-cyclic AMP phosphodiesterase CpdA
MRILLVTDSHLASMAPPCNENWQAAKAFAGRAGGDLTIHLGDITLDGIADRRQHDWAVAASADWPTPLRFIPGNHDVGDNPPGPGVPAKDPLDLDLLAQYRRQFGWDYWVLDAPPWRLIALDAQLFGSGTADEAEQWRWLAARLAETEGRPLILLLHKPLFLDHPATTPTPHIRYVPPQQRRKLLDLFAPVDLRLVLSGHTHQYRDHTVGGVRHIWLPSTAFVIPDPMQDRIGEKVTGLGVLDLGEECRFDLVCPDGMRRHSLSDPALAALLKPPAPAAAAHGRRR